jgi:hypothetical protein
MCKAVSFMAQNAHLMSKNFRYKNESFEGTISKLCIHCYHHNAFVNVAFLIKTEYQVAAW